MVLKKKQNHAYFVEYDWPSFNLYMTKIFSVQMSDDVKLVKIFIFRIVCLCF